MLSLTVQYMSNWTKIQLAHLNVSQSTVVPRAFSLIFLSFKYLLVLLILCPLDRFKMAPRIAAMLRALRKLCGFSYVLFVFLLFYVLGVVSITVYDRDTLLNIGSSIEAAKRQYRNKVEEQFNTNNPRSMWQGINNITGFKGNNPKSRGSGWYTRPCAQSMRFPTSQGFYRHFQSVPLSVCGSRMLQKNHHCPHTKEK